MMHDILIQERLRIIHDGWRQFEDQDDEIEAWNYQRMKERIIVNQGCNKSSLRFRFGL